MQQLTNAHQSLDIVIFLLTKSTSWASTSPWQNGICVITLHVQQSELFACAEIVSNTYITYIVPLIIFMIRVA